nr:uncharacterized protein LOC118681071 [Bactrocera oleae]
MRLPTSQEEFFTELSERKRRETNVIALNIPESDKAAGKDRLEDDRTKLVTALPPSLKDEATELKLRRLGRPTPVRTRPLHITTRSAADALSIIKYRPTDENSGFIFKTDLTPSQQLHLKNLRQELDSIVKTGDDSNTIKYIHGVPRIVKRNFRPLNEQEESILRPPVLPERQRSAYKTLNISNRISG